MDPTERAMPHLEAAQQAIWTVREACADQIMEAYLAAARENVALAQIRLRVIEGQARDAGMVRYG